MKQTTIIFKKEMLESWRSYRVLILAVAFIFFGILSPFTAKLLPEILDQFTPEGITITIADPSYMDSWLQFYDNMYQMGLLIIFILFAGLLVDEYQKETLPMLLTKGLQSTAITYGKFIATAALITATYLAGFLICILYTWIYFQTGINLEILIGSLSILLGYLLIIALFLFWGSIFSKISAVFLTAAGSVALLMVANLHPKIQNWNPISLFTIGTKVIQTPAQIGDYMGAYIVTIILAISLLATTTYFLKRREI